MNHFRELVNNHHKPRISFLDLCSGLMNSIDTCVHFPESCSCGSNRPNGLLFDDSNS